MSYFYLFNPSNKSLFKSRRLLIIKDTKLFCNRLSRVDCQSRKVQKLKQKMYKFGIAVVFMLAVNAAVGFWTPCTGLPPPTFATSISCDADLCTVRRGDMLIAQAGFIATRAHQRLEVTMTTSFLGIPINLEIEEEWSNACTLLQGGHVCPLAPGGNFVWDLHSPIPLNYPALSNVIIRSKFTG